MVSFVAPLLTWCMLAASFVIGLAAVMRMSGAASGVSESPSVIRLPEQVTEVIAGLFALAALVFLAHVLRRGFARRRPGDDEAGSGLEAPRVPPWLRALRQILAVANGVVLAYLLWRGAIPLSLFALGSGAGSGPGFGFPRAISQSAPLLVTWTFGILAFAAGLGALGFAVWIAVGDGPAREPAERLGPPPAAPLRSAVDESLETLRSEPDARRAIIRCYAGFERAAAASGVARQPWLTPMEFMREAASRLPVPRTAVPTLTGLFELARFSDHALGAADRDRAVDALSAIRAAMHDEEDDAGVA